MSLDSKLFRTTAVTILTLGLVFASATDALALETSQLTNSSKDDTSDDGESLWEKAKEMVGMGNDNKRCVDPDWSFSIDAGTMTVTAEGRRRDEPGDPICDPLPLAATKSPYTAIGKFYPQGTAEVTELTISSLGTFEITIPNWPGDGCAQGSFYANWESDGGLSSFDLSKPMETEKSKRAPYVHEILKGRGPSPSWVQASTDGCNVPVPVTTSATLTVKSCDENSQNLITALPANGAIWSLTDKKGRTQDLADIGEGYTGGLPEGLEYGVEYTVSSRDGDGGDKSDITPWSQKWTPVESVDCFLYDASASVTESEPTDDDKSTVQFYLENAKWDTEPDLSVGTHERTATAIPPHLFPVDPTPENGNVKGVETITIKYEIKAPLEDSDATVIAPPSNNNEEAASSNGVDSSPSGFDLGPIIAALFVAVVVIIVCIIILLILRRRSMQQEQRQLPAKQSPDQGWIDEQILTRVTPQSQPPKQVFVPVPPAAHKAVHAADNTPTVKLPLGSVSADGVVKITSMP